MDDSFYTEKTLQAMRVGTFFRKKIEVGVEHLIERDEMIYRLESYVLAEKLAEDTYTRDVVVSYPGTTWQFFKSTHMDSWWFRWFVKRRPVRQKIEKTTVEVVVERYLRYPKADASFSKELGRPVLFEQIKGE